MEIVSAMAKLYEYRLKVQQLLDKYIHYKPGYGDVEIEQIRVLFLTGVM